MTSKPEYLFPRIGIVDLSKSPNLDLLLNQIQSYHGKYYQIFNLTNAPIFSSDKVKDRETKFKWRGVPFSITEAIKILNRMDLFLRTNKGNAVIFCVNSSDSYLFARVLVREYVKICDFGVAWEQKNLILSKKLHQHLASMTHEQAYFSQSLQQIYRQKQIALPPVKTICSLQISSSAFIPMFQIWQQSRYNDFELVYTHDICNQLVKYYFNLNKPLEKDRKSTGKKFYDRKPETKYLTRPVTVCGDVKIVCYSFNTLEKKEQFSFGFNTKKLLFSEEFGDDEGVLTFKYQDLFGKSLPQNENQLNYQSSSLKLFDQSVEVYIKTQNWCQEGSCVYESKCDECQQHCKRLNLRYNQTQTELNKLYRQRSPQQLSQYFSLE